MKLFTDLLKNISKARDEHSKVHLLIEYFENEIEPSDHDIALKLLLGNYPKRIIQTKHLKQWAAEITSWPDWLIERSEKEVGNFTETFNLLLRQKDSSENNKTLTRWLSELEKLRNENIDSIKVFIHSQLCELDDSERLILLKLLTGSFKTPVSKNELVSCLSHILKIPSEIIILRMYDRKNKELSLSSLRQKIDSETMKIPLNFPEIKTIDHMPDYGDESNWKIFGKIDGIDVQLIKYEESVNLWTRNGDIITDKFPEIASVISKSATNFKIFGQIIPKNPSTSIEKLLARIGKKNPSSKDILEAEAGFEVWDFLEGDPEKIADLFRDHQSFKPMQKINCSSKEEIVTIHDKSRDNEFTGLCFTQKTQADYILWKADSYSLNAVLMYVEMGGIVNTPILSMTFGVFQNEEICPIAKISSFPETIDFDEIIEYVKSNTIEKFGPVRTVNPQWIYALQYDAILKAPRRKSGIALSNVRLLKKISENPAHAHQLESLKE